MAYTGYSGYDAESVKRQRALADALLQRTQQSRGQPIQSWTQGAARLADAYFAREAGDRASALEGEYKASQQKLGDAMLSSMFPDAANVEAPLDLRPDAVANTNAALQATAPTAKLGAQVRNVAQFTGDPMAAAQFGLALQQRDLENRRYDQERKDKLRTPVMIAKGADAIADPDGDGSWERIFENPGPTALPPGSTLHSTQILDDGHILKTFRDGRQEVSPYVASDSYGTVDIGGVPTTISRRTGGIQSTVTPEQVGGNKSVVNDITKRGEAQTQAAIDLPTTIAVMEDNISAIEQMISHPKIASRYGWRGVAPPLPGEESAAQALIDQVKGAAFLQAYDDLKGSGQITEIEGKKATQAKTRVENQWQDWPSAKKAAEELLQIARNGILRAKAKAGQIDLSTLTDAQLDILEGK